MRLLKELSEAGGVSGREDAIRKIVMRELKGHVDSLTVDTMGNVIALRKGSSKERQRIMFAAHMDEIGFYASYVDDAGFVRLQEVGGFDTRNLFARRVVVHSKRGPLRGVLTASAKPIHMSTPEERRGYKEVSDFYVDLGLPGKEVKKRVEVGDMVTLDAPFVEFGSYASGKCLDNRVQVYVGIRALQALKKRPKDDIYGVFTVQEEVGLRGAFTSTYGIEPHIGIALDTTVAADIPGVPGEQRVTSLGKGVGIKVLDGNLISHRGLVDEFVALAKRNKITYQLEILPRGGTDAGAIQRSRTGVKTITLSIPTRYLHTVVETVHKDDVLATEALLKKFLDK
jgi:putative aminopeptidase FrvX